MTEHSALERRYRRWLAFYPRSFRADREEEMLAVLLHGAEAGRTHPKVSEAASLATHGMGRRAGRRFPGEWERAHARIMFPVRVATAVWLSFMSVLLIGFHRGEPWLAVLIPAIVIHLYLAYQIRPSATHR